jgi:hypothetical protein
MCEAPVTLATGATAITSLRFATGSLRYGSPNVSHFERVRSVGRSPALCYRKAAEFATVSSGSRHARDTMRSSGISCSSRWRARAISSTEAAGPRASLLPTTPRARTDSASRASSRTWGSRAPLSIRSPSTRSIGRSTTGSIPRWPWHLRGGSRSIPGIEGGPSVGYNCS